MEKRLTFNSDEINYDKYRPDYPVELYEKIFSYKSLNPSSNLLEIGIGTGQATEPFLKAGCNITAVELGDKLSSFVKSKYSEYNNLNVINDDFMKCKVKENAFDLVYCATAFHWLPYPERYEKVLKCLKSGGTIALFWNHPYPNRDDDKSNLASQSVYNKYRKSDDKQIEFSENECKKYVDELKKAGFTNVEYSLFHRIRILTTDDYLHLINTYSDHIMLPADVKENFENDMRKAIDNVGGKINIYDTIDLYLATKK